jgi:hypothetical protein
MNTNVINPDPNHLKVLYTALTPKNYETKYQKFICNQVEPDTQGLLYNVWAFPKPFS